MDPIPIITEAVFVSMKRRGKRKEKGIKKYKTIPIDTTKIYVCRKTYHLTATIQHHPLPFSKRVGEERTRHVTPPADDDLSIYLPIIRLHFWMFYLSSLLSISACFLWSHVRASSSSSLHAADAVDDLPPSLPSFLADSETASSAAANLNPPPLQATTTMSPPRQLTANSRTKEVAADAEEKEQ